MLSMIFNPSVTTFDPVCDDFDPVCETFDPVFVLQSADQSRHG